jgi:hypothetical protein
MNATVGPATAAAAVAFRQANPAASALDALDAALANRGGQLWSFGDAIQPATPFGLLIAEAFDSGMAPEDWHLASNPNTPPSAKAVLMDLWQTEVLAKLAAH